MTPAPPRSRFSLWLVAAFLGGILAVLIGISFAQELRRRLVLQQHVRVLQNDIREREQRIANLQQLTEYLQTDAYQERAAREKLSYQKPGEHVVIVPERPTPSGAVAGEDTMTLSPKAPITLQWWNYLFGPSIP